MVERSQAALWPAHLDPIRRTGSREADRFSPASEARADAAAYYIFVELPGVKEGDVTLAVEKNLLLVTGEKRRPVEAGNEGWFFSECRFGAFVRSFRLSPDALPDAMAMAFANGVLTITIPRRKVDAPDSA